MRPWWLPPTHNMCPVVTQSCKFCVTKVVGITWEPTYGYPQFLSRGIPQRLHTAGLMCLDVIIVWWDEFVCCTSSLFLKLWKLNTAQTTTYLNTYILYTCIVYNVYTRIYNMCVHVRFCSGFFVSFLCIVNLWTSGRKIMLRQEKMILFGIKNKNIFVLYCSLCVLFYDCQRSPWKKK